MAKLELLNRISQIESPKNADTDKNVFNSIYQLFWFTLCGRFRFVTHSCFIASLLTGYTALYISPV